MRCLFSLANVLNRFYFSFKDEEGLSFATPDVPTDQNIDSVFGRFTKYFFGRTNVSSAPDVRSSPGYRVKFFPVWTKDVMK